MNKGYIVFGLALVGVYLMCDREGFVLIASLMFLGLGISELAKKRQ